MLASLLISVGAVAAISTFLAVLMVIAEATIGNYGEVQITINDQKKLTVQGGRPLLSTLMSEGIFIPSACGGKGSCGLCKLKATKGVGAYLPTELPWLSDDEKTKAIRLACQVKVKEDLEIHIPEELFSVREFRTRVAQLRDLTYDIKEVTLELLEPQEIDFRAGQFVQFEVPEYELTTEPVYRAYSIASHPDDKNHVQLEIRSVPNGLCTTYVHKHLKLDEQITINGPYGEFFLRETEHEIIFIAGGSGMAPIRSMLYDMAHKGVSRKAAYFFGARSARDLFLVDEMRELEQRLTDFTFVPALSEPLPEDNWQGQTGLITDVVAAHYPTLDNHEAYLCGSPGMIDACVAVLTKKGMPEELVYYDKFA